MYPGSRSDHIHNLFLPWRPLSDLDLTVYSFLGRVALVQGCCAFGLKGLAIDTASLSFNSPFVRSKFHPDFTTSRIIAMAPTSIVLYQYGDNMFHHRWTDDANNLAFSV
jgi:hypothetical protein